jgi:hypothetical protein
MEFTHNNSGETDYASVWKLNLSDIAGVDTNVLLCYASATLGYVEIPGMAGAGGFVKNNAFGLLSGNNGIVTTDITGLFANPTATIGLTVVNGSATSAMRSDAAPPLSQAITPTWTGDHLWGTTKKVGFRDAALYISSKNDGYLDFDADTAFRFNTGMVGINCTPVETMDILGKGKNPLTRPAGILLVRDNNALAANIGGNIVFGSMYTAEGVYTDGAAIRVGKDNATSGEYGYYFAIHTRTNGSATVDERMSISSVGRIYMNNLSDLTASGDYSRLLMQNSNTLEIGFVTLAEMTGGHSYKSVVWDDDDNKFCLVTAV